MNNYELTKYPLLYKKTYWGKINYEDNLKNIIRNRNIFIENLSIIKYLTKVPQYISNEYVKYDFIDHVEVYLTSDKKYIIISSPYNESKKEYYKYRWIKINRLYNNSAHTWMKIIEMRPPGFLKNKTINLI